MLRYIADLFDGDAVKYRRDAIAELARTGVNPRDLHSILPSLGGHRISRLILDMRGVGFSSHEAAEILRNAIGRWKAANKRQRATGWPNEKRLRTATFSTHYAEFTSSEAYFFDACEYAGDEVWRRGPRE